METTMTDNEINKVVSKVLRERLKEFGFKRCTVHSEEDFDGSSILRIIAHCKKWDVPSSRLTDALHEIRSKLLSKGEERFVLLGSQSPSEESIEEDVD
jgi:hypothetical protein